MKISIRLLFGIVVSVLCLCDVNANTFLCPEGCFCLNDGKVEKNSTEIFFLGGGNGSSPEMWEENPYIDASQMSAANKARLQAEYEASLTEGAKKLRTLCGLPAFPLNPGQLLSCTATGWIKVGKSNVVCDRQRYLNNYVSDGDHVDYNVDDFLEFYTDAAYSYEMKFGGYGIKGKDIVYFPIMQQRVFPCPVSYPLSKSGAKTLNECFTYDINGNKTYYKPRQNNSKDVDFVNVSADVNQMRPVKGTSLRIRNQK
ncbi:MAG: hypothetical protein IJL05_03670 [Alphaproteobacteria bacterium]|nr:hypothetical protein [Alphaproteobacteria bacterium]